MSPSAQQPSGAPDRERPRQTLLVALILGIPVLFGIGLIALSDLAGSEPTGKLPTRQTSRVQAPAPAASGTRAPRVRLTDARSGRPFDSASLRAPYAVVLLSTRCPALAAALRPALAQLQQDSSPAVVLGISATPAADTPTRARAWLRRLHLPSDLHYLVGSGRELRPYWSAWGSAPSDSTGDRAACEGVAPAHLVTAAGVNAGVVDLPLEEPTTGLATALEAMTG